MKKAMLLLSSALLCALVIVNPASAHVLETDGSIGAVLHIQPDDNPTAGIPTTYEFAFSDTKDSFSLSNCDCAVTMKLSDKTVETLPLTVSSALNSVDNYTFKVVGVYTIVVTGAPKTGNSFQPFSLNYVVRVQANGQLNTQPFPLTLGIGFGFMIVLLLLVAVKADGMMDEK